ncbi:35515_t:CDS:2 [Gigaspora margarita]|uniref:35515_t:CDS:1 n=1 Tax=Gigaspora margarita TaxID=4874 RepID=A0ABM8W227_GIGMA|nr:35515_t:CDS:2 [Gigaspora margarita]
MLYWCYGKSKILAKPKEEKSIEVNEQATKKKDQKIYLYLCSFGASIICLHSASIKHLTSTYSTLAKPKEVSELDNNKKNKSKKLNLIYVCLVLIPLYIHLALDLLSKT